MFNFEDALELVLTGRKGSGQKKIDRNTYLIDRGDHIAVRLHQTDIVKLYANGEVVLNTGGWETVTTKDRMNRYSPFYVQQRKNVWSVWQRDNSPSGDRRDKFCGLFFDGMRLTHTGRILNKTAQAA